MTAACRIVAVLACFANLAASAADFAFAVPYFESVADNDAIPGGIAGVLAQDRTGLIWIGSRRGLVRYDGYRFRTFTHQRDDARSISGDVIAALAVDDAGRLWVGTRSDGVSVLAPGREQFTHHRHRDGDATTLSHDEVRAIATADDQVWIGTEGGLDRYDAAGDRFVRFRHRDDDARSLANDHVRSLLVDRAGNLWIGTRSGLDVRRRGASDFEHVASAPDDPASLYGDPILSLHEASDGRIWIGTSDRGAAWFDPRTNTLHRLPVDARRDDALSHGRVTRIIEPRPGTIWIGTMGGGINVVDPATDRVVRRIRHEATVRGSLALDQIGDFLVDRSGLVWVGSWGGGLQRYQAQERAFRTLRADLAHTVLSDANVSSVMEARDGRIWIGSRNSGVDVVDRARGRIASIRPDADDPDALADGAIYAIAQTNDGSVWMGSQLTGVFRTSPDVGPLRHYGDAEGLPKTSVNGLTAAKDGGLYVAMDGGAAYWDAASDRFTMLHHADGAVFDEAAAQVLEDHDGRLWVGGTAGLYTRARGASGLVRIPARAEEPGALVHDDVRGMLLDQRGTFWIATAQGLVRFAGWDGDTPRFDDFSAAVGRPGLHLGGNLLDDAQGRIWTQRYMIDPATRELYELTRADGVDIGTAWNGSFARTRDGLLLYGGSQGLLIVDPRDFETWRYEPPMVATQLLVNGHPRLVSSLAGGLSLDPDERSFSVEFAALDYSAPQRLRYSYRLQGFDREWIATDAEHRVASYTNLAPGDYVLDIRGSNRLGAWSPNELHVPVRVLPSFWQTTSFKVLVVLFAALALLVIFRWRISSLSRSEARLRQMVDERTALLRTQAEQLQYADAEKNELLAQLRRQADAFERQAREDPLTGLANRRAFTQAHAEAFAAARREDRPLTVAMLDLDHFKRINDEFAHAAGDAALRHIAEVLRREVPAGAIVARYGGEEFAILFPGLALDDARAACERLRVAVAASHLDGVTHGLRVTISIGLADAVDVPTPDRMISQADMALYEAKRGGRNRVCG